MIIVGGTIIPIQDCEYKGEHPKVLLQKVGDTTMNHEVPAFATLSSHAVPYALKDLGLDDVPEGSMFLNNAKP